MKITKADHLREAVINRGVQPLTTCFSANQQGSCFSPVKPVSDRRAYEFLTVGGDAKSRGVRFLLASDPEAVFAAACLNMQAGYFDDPPSVPGFAHWLEHAVHLGSSRYPDDKDYKYFLSQHGGTSNASTGMVHTSYHFTVSSPHLGAAVDRLARFFIDPLLHRDSILKEAENVHAEFSRNCNSDSRKLLQLRRAAAGGLLGKFSTGNAATLLERPAAAGLDVPAALAAFWRERYLAGALCGCVVGPQSLSELRRMVVGAFAGVRLRNEDGADPRVSGARPDQEYGTELQAPHPEATEGGGSFERSSLAAREGEVGTEGGYLASLSISGGGGGGDGVGGDGGSGGSGGAAAAAVRYDFEDMCTPGRLGQLFRVSSQRELRQLEVVWYLPYGMMNDIKIKPWRWAGHVLGHEGRGSLAAVLRGAGLAQELTTGSFDEVRLGRGFMFWGVTLTLSGAGLQRAEDVMRLVFAAVRAMRSLSEEQRRAVWEEVAAAAAVRWQYQDRTAPLDLARDVAQRLHYFEPQSVLSDNALLYEYDRAALERFLSYITPENCNVYLSDSSFAGRTDRVEEWYGARYSKEPLNLDLYGIDACDAAAAANGGDADVDMAGSPEDPYPLLLSRLRLPQPPSWALPVDVRLVSEVPADTPGVPGANDGDDVIMASEGAPGGAAGDAAPTASAAGPPAPLEEQPGQERTTHGNVPPKLLDDNGIVRLWHRTDVSFGVPKIHMFVHIITRAVYDTPASWATARLACRLMEELLQPDVYDAQLVGTSYSLSASETGLHLSFHGFSYVAAKLAEVVATAMSNVTLQQVQARYAFVHGKLLRSLRLWRQNNPAAHAEYGTEHVLQLPHWHVDESILVLQRAMAPTPPPPPPPPPLPVSAPPSAAVVEAHSPAAAAAVVGEAVRHGDGDLAAAGPVAVWEFLRGLGRGTALEVLVYGNSTEQQARELCAMLQRHLRPTGLGPDGWPATRILELVPEASAPPAGWDIPSLQPAQSPGAGGVVPGPRTLRPQPLGRKVEDMAADTQVEVGGEVGGVSRGPGTAAGVGDEEAVKVQFHVGPSPSPSPSPSTASGVAARSGGPMLLRYVPVNPNPTNTNSAVFFLCQVGEDDPRDIRPAVLLDFLAKVASKPAFHELRTRQRLGYVVSLNKHRLGGGMGLAVRVQSPDRQPGVLRLRVAEWLESFGRELRELAPERLASFKFALAEKYQEPPRSLAEAAGATWRPIRYRSYAFRKAERKAAALRELGLQDLVQFYEQHACPSSPTARVLCCEVWGGVAAQRGGDAGEMQDVTSVGGAGWAGATAEAAEAEGGDDVGASGWRRVGPQDVAELHQRLPHFCHSETLGVLRPLPVTHGSPFES
ncbi:hypothetical protein VaNZ11_002876 [Volvox africanus]|uniref:Insulin-degrading enzyme n=1 Tax=Volvox africanus TaxID=51714 RepID=A0ABQ5RT82_9CHLO|nr:hypothetical protein VaNZ11_002876 [Volvox africanus]